MPNDETEITRDDVIWCFENILGRGINDETLVGHFLKTENNFKSLVKTIVSSKEFYAIKDRAKNMSVDKYGFVYDESPGVRARVIPFLKTMQPLSANGYAKIRAGNENDGGYVMLDDFVGVSAAYSLGISNDVSWDKDIASRGIDVYQYDHTIDGLPEENERFFWSKLGISADGCGEFTALSGEMDKNGHEVDSNLLLKCDIEGYEWEVLAEMPARRLEQFRQIVIETHDWHRVLEPDFFERMERAISNLRKNHSLIHVHANNNAAYSIVGGIPLPAVLELSYVRTADYELTDSVEVFPTQLDAPCSSVKADFSLGRFLFSELE